MTITEPAQPTTEADEATATGFADDATAWAALGSSSVPSAPTSPPATTEQTVPCFARSDDDETRRRRPSALLRAMRRSLGSARFEVVALVAIPVALAVVVLMGIVMMPVRPARSTSEGASPGRGLSPDAPPSPAAVAGDAGGVAWPAPAVRSIDTQRFELVAACADDDLGVAANAGEGPVVAYVGDSITSQLRRDLLADRSQRTVVASHCGERLGGALEHGYLTAALAARPDVLVIALGTNEIATDFRPDAGQLPARLAALDQVLAATDGVSCRVFVNVGATTWGNPEPVGTQFIQLASAVNQRFARIDPRAHRGVHIADWDRLLAEHPEYTFDGVHVTAEGRAARIDLIRRTIAESCPPGVPARPVVPVSVTR